MNEHDQDLLTNASALTFLSPCFRKVNVRRTLFHNLPTKEGCARMRLVSQPIVK